MSDKEEKDGGKVYDAELLEPEQRASPGGRESFRADAGVGRYYDAGPGGFWVMPFAASGCAPPFITIALFLFCLVQYGILAGIGFLVFHVTGLVIGGARAARLLMRGQPFNPWAWRLGNWLIPLLLTVWLSGGFDK